MRATVILSALLAALAVSAVPTPTVDERAVAELPAEGGLAPRDDNVLDAKKKRLAGRIVAYGEPAPRQVNPPQHEQDSRHWDWHHPKPPPKPSSKWPHWKREDDDDIDHKTGRKKPKQSKKPHKP